MPRLDNAIKCQVDRMRQIVMAISPGKMGSEENGVSVGETGVRVQKLINARSAVVLSESVDRKREWVVEAHGDGCEMGGIP